eukprot:3089723-Lingulodinium_polyedra.AAC.1
MEGANARFASRRDTETSFRPRRRAATFPTLCAKMRLTQRFAAAETRKSQARAFRAGQFLV